MGLVLGICLAWFLIAYVTPLMLVTGFLGVVKVKDSFSSK